MSRPQLANHVDCIIKETMKKNKCLKCQTVTKDEKDDIYSCPNPDCGLKWEVTHSGEWIIHGNLNLAWSLKAIELPEKLTIRGDLNLMGCRKDVRNSHKSLIVNGNIFMCKSDFANIPPDFCFDGYLFCHQTEFQEQKGKFFYTKECIKFVRLAEKLPELEGWILF